MFLKIRNQQEHLSLIHIYYPDYNIRSSSRPNVYGEKFVLRLLKKNANIKSIFDLGFYGAKEHSDIFTPIS